MDNIQFLLYLEIRLDQFNLFKWVEETFLILFFSTSLDMTDDISLCEMEKYWSFHRFVTEAWNIWIACIVHYLWIGYVLMSVAFYRKIASRVVKCSIKYVYLSQALFRAYTSETKACTCQLVQDLLIQQF